MLALIKEYIEPINRILLVLSQDIIMISIIEIKDCNNNNERNVLNQALKIQYVDEFIKDNKTNGQQSINTCIIIYLKE